MTHKGENMDIEEFNYDDRSNYKVNVNNLLIEELKSEALLVKDNLADYDKNFNSENQEIYYILSSKWFAKWKKYVSYDEVINGKPPQPYVGQFKPDPMNEDIVVEITNSSECEYVKDYDRSEPLNIFLKPFIKQDRDYIIIPEKISEVFYEKYDGHQVPRKAYMTSLGKVVEVKPRLISLIAIDNDLLKSIDFKRIHSFLIKKVQVHSFMTLQELKTRLKGFSTDLFPQNVEYQYNKRYNPSSIDLIRLWKLDPEVPLETAFDSVKKICNDTKSTDYKIPMKGMFLEKNLDMKFEELGLTDTDYVIMENREEGKGWNFIQEGVESLDKCENCMKYGKNSYTCRCKKVSYCSEECKLKDQRYHMNHCDKADLTDDEEELEWKPIENSRNGITGLSNLGNTCFMNSALQCMSNTYPLTEYFLTRKYVREINADNPLGTQGKLAKRYGTFLKALWYDDSSVFSPYGIKVAVAKLNPIFSGYQQHDSSEFLNYILDGLHEDLNRVKKKAVTDKIECFEKGDEEKVAKLSWINHLRRNQSVVVDLMHGQFKSKIICPDCGKISITFDPFLTWSMPIPIKLTKEVEILFIPSEFSQEKQIKIKLSFKKQTHTLKDLKQEIAEKLKKKPEELVCCSVSTDKLNLEFEDSNLTKEAKKKCRYYNQFAVCEMGDGMSIPDDLKLAVPIRLARWSLSYMNTYRTKTFSYIRPFFMSRKTTGLEVKKKVFRFFRKYFDMIMAKRNPNYDPSKTTDVELEELIMKPVVKDEKKGDNIEEEKRDIESDQDCSLPYRVVVVTNNYGYSDCYFCGKRKCKNCPIPDDTTLEELMSKIESKYFTFEIEVIWDNPFPEVSLDVINEFNDPDNPKAPEKEKESDNNTMAIEDKKASKNVPTKSLEDCINLFSTPEILEEGNEWYCNICKDHKRATKIMECYKAPKILVIHLKRFKDAKSSYSYYNFSGGKNSTKVNFPLNGLNLAKFVINKELPSSYLEGRTPEEVIMEVEQLLAEKKEENSETKEEKINEETKDDLKDLEEGQKNPLPKFVSRLKDGEGEEKDLIYDCYAISNHYGNVGGGHYTAYAKNELNGKWYCFDDSHCSETNSDSVITEAAYLLFYKRRETNI